jgi:release factor glutamine methyltransferase
MKTENEITVGEALRLGTDQLRAAGIESPALDMGLLLADALGLSRLQIYMNSERPLTDAERSRARELLRRRLRREPIAYILGYKEFFGLRLKVTPAVLIPRPETELLVEIVRDWLRLHSVDFPAPRIAEIGAGSGAISIALARELPDANVLATDLSADALAIARENAAAQGLLNRITFRQGSLFDPFFRKPGAPLQFDALISNPPYVPESDRTRLSPEVVVYEPGEALFGGPDGLEYLKAIIAGAHQYLKPGALLALECGQGQAELLVEELRKSGKWGGIEAHADLAGILRVVKCLFGR